MTTSHLKVKKWKFEFVRHETKESSETILKFYFKYLAYYVWNSNGWSFPCKRHYRILLNLYLIAFAIGIEEKICPGNTWVLHDNQVLQLAPSFDGLTKIK